MKDGFKIGGQGTVYTPSPKQLEAMPQIVKDAIADGNIDGTEAIAIDLASQDPATYKSEGNGAKTQFKTVLGFSDAQFAQIKTLSQRTQATDAKLSITVGDNDNAPTKLNPELAKGATTNIFNKSEVTPGIKTAIANGNISPSEAFDLTHNLDYTGINVSAPDSTKQAVAKKMFGQADLTKLTPPQTTLLNKVITAGAAEYTKRVNDNKTSITIGGETIKLYPGPAAGQNPDHFPKSDMTPALKSVLAPNPKDPSDQKGNISADDAYNLTNDLDYTGINVSAPDSTKQAVAKKMFGEVNLDKLSAPQKNLLDKVITAGTAETKKRYEAGKTSITIGDVTVKLYPGRQSINGTPNKSQPSYTNEIPSIIKSSMAKDGSISNESAYKIVIGSDYDKGVGKTVDARSKDAVSMKLFGKHTDQLSANSPQAKLLDGIMAGYTSHSHMLKVIQDNK